MSKAGLTKVTFIGGTFRVVPIDYEALKANMEAASAAGAIFIEMGSGATKIAVNIENICFIEPQPSITGEVNE